MLTNVDGFSLKEAGHSTGKSVEPLTLGGLDPMILASEAATSALHARLPGWAAVQLGGMLVSWPKQATWEDLTPGQQS